MTLDNLLARGRNNLDFIRLAAAVGVIVSHAYPLARGPGFEVFDPVVLITNRQETLGGVSVAVFFILSGFLVTASYERARDPIRYLSNRFLRIFPALLPLFMLTVLVLGPLTTFLSASDYFAHPGTWRYLEGLSLYKLHYALPGVFLSNVYPVAVNGSLWTLAHELDMYLAVLALGVLRLLRRWVVLAVLAVALAWQVFGWSAALLDLLGVESRVWDVMSLPRMALTAKLGGFFFAGAAAYLLRDRLRLSRLGAWAALGAIVAACALGQWFVPVFTVAGAYLVLYLGAVPSRLAGWSERFGDLSYGTYIYAFPVQQTLVHLAGGSMAVWANAALAIPVTLMLAALSWRFVERPALTLKRLRRRPAPQAIVRPYRDAT